MALSIVCAVYLFLNGFGLILAIYVTADDYEKFKRLEKTSLYDNKKNEYQTRITEARKLFSFEPVIQEPFYAVKFGVNYANAEYSYWLKCILINERLIVDFSLEELAAVIAHELAHAEFVEKTGGIEIRNHWQVDLRAAELTNPDWVGSYLLKFINQLDNTSLKQVEWLRSKRILFPLTYYLENGAYLKHKEELNLRLSWIRKFKQSFIEVGSLPKPD